MRPLRPKQLISSTWLFLVPSVCLFVCVWPCVWHMRAHGDLRQQANKNSLQMSSLNIIYEMTWTELRSQSSRKLCTCFLEYQQHVCECRLTIAFYSILYYTIEFLLAPALTSNSNTSSHKRPKERIVSYALKWLMCRSLFTLFIANFFPISSSSTSQHPSCLNNFPLQLFVFIFIIPTSSSTRTTLS